MKPVVLLIDEGSFLTSRSLIVDTITINNEPKEFCKDYRNDSKDLNCYGQYYQVLDTPKGPYKMLVCARLGEEALEYNFVIR